MQTAYPVDRLAGMTVGGYQVERLLNHGKLGTVYVASKNEQEQPVMITLFSLPAAFSDAARAQFLVRFSQETRKLVQLRHPSILPLYNCGQYTDYPYLVSAFVKGKSLAQILKQEPLFSAQQVLRVLKQVSIGLDAIHRSGAFHGLLNATNIIIDDAQTVQLAGLGLRPILEIYAIEPDRPYGHLYSIAGTFLGAPEYLAPECAENRPLDGRADIYSLGIVAFELLTGARPFSGENQLETVLKRSQLDVPSVQSLRTSVPTEFDAVIQKALQRSPEHRYQSAGEMVNAFEQVVRALKMGRQPEGRTRAPQVKSNELTLPPTVNWFEDEDAEPKLGRGVPNTTVGYLSSVQRTSDGRLMAQGRANDGSGNPTARNQQGQGMAANVVGREDPFALWTATSAKMNAQNAPAMGANRPRKKTETASAKTVQQRNVANPQRRRVIALLAAGAGVAAAGVIAFEGLHLAHLLPNEQTAQVVNPPITKKAQSAGAQGKSTTTKTGTTQGQAKKNQGSKQNAQPTRVAPQHTGTVIGSKTLAVNSAQVFKNPADGNESLLIHLPNGTFVASERACTHQGVAVNYHADTHTLVCPLHGATFDPADNFKVLQGPATMPLPTVAIKVNTDGTITAL